MSMKTANSDVYSGRTPTQFRPWRELSALTLLWMELSVIVLAYRALSAIGKETSPAYTYAVFGTILMLTYGLTRSLYYLRLKTSARRAAALVMLVLSWLLALKLMLYRDEVLTIGTIIRRNVEAFADRALFLPAEFGMLLVVLLLVLRGVVSAQRWMGAIVVVRSFRVSAGVFLALGLLQVVPWDMLPGVEFHLFLFAGLISMSAARASELGGLRGGIIQPFDRSWLVSVAAGAGLVVILVLVMAVLATTYLAQPTAMLATMAAEALLFLLLLILSPLLFLFLVLFPQFAQDALSDLVLRLERLLHLSAVREILNEVFQAILAFISGLVELLLSILKGIPDLSVLKPYLLAAIILMVVLFLFVLLGRQRHASVPRARGREDRQSILDWKGFRILLSQLFQRSMDGMERGINRLRHGGRLLAAARIRRIYTQLMRLCDELQFPRLDAQTPLEFLSTLQGRFPDHVGELTHITQAYLRVRYGELPETRAQVSLVEAAWQAVRQQGEVIRKSQQAARGAEPRSIFKR